MHDCASYGRESNSPSTRQFAPLEISLSRSSDVDIEHAKQRMAFTYASTEG